MMKVILENLPIIKKENWKNIFDRLFAVCKMDPNFRANDKIQEIDIEISELEKKLRKNKEIIKRADEYRKDLERKVKLLDEQNYEAKSLVLEKLGSEI